MALEKCGCCNGMGQIFVHRPTTGPSQIEDCSNCSGNGYVITTADLFVGFKLKNELPPVRWK